MDKQNTVKNQTKNEGGFTLIELLTVVAVVSVLSGVALQEFFTYRARTYDTSAKESLRNAITVQELIFTDTENYTPCASSVACAAALPGFNVTNGVQISFTTPGPNQFIGVATHPAGALTWEYDSDVGVIVER